MEPKLLEVTKPFRLPEDDGCCHAGYYAVAARVRYSNDHVANEIYVSEEPIHLNPAVSYEDLPSCIHISDHANQMAEHILTLSRRLGETASAFPLTGPLRTDS